MFRSCRGTGAEKLNLAICSRRFRFWFIIMMRNSFGADFKKKSTWERARYFGADVLWHDIKGGIIWFIGVVDFEICNFLIFSHITNANVETQIFPGANPLCLPPPPFHLVFLFCVTWKAPLDDVTQKVCSRVSISLWSVQSWMKGKLKDDVGEEVRKLLLMAWSRFLLVYLTYDTFRIFSLLKSPWTSSVCLKLFPSQ